MSNIKRISPYLAVSTQIAVEDVAALYAAGYRAIINNRPDGEAADQPGTANIGAECARLNMSYRYLPITPGKLGDMEVRAFVQAQRDLQGPVLAYCRTGTRSTTLWALSQAHRLSIDAILQAARGAGYDIDDLRPRLESLVARRQNFAAMSPATERRTTTYDAVIVGGGTAGIATAVSMLQRRPELDIAIVEPRERHFYQPGFTLAGAGVFELSQIARKTVDVMPDKVRWIRTAAAGFDPHRNEIVLEDASRVRYRQLVVAPGIKLDWDQIEGLSETLGANGVTSNYRYDLTRYTWQLVRQLRQGRAIFTQPPMPIKCAGAPQKAMYLSCDYWLGEGVLADIDVGFYNAGGVLFGVDAYVPALMKYVEKYNAGLNFAHNLVAVDGPANKAWFDLTGADTEPQRVEVDFDMLHVCPPQTAPDFVRHSPLADPGGWIDVAPDTLRHPLYDNIYGLGDACSSPNAKTMAAVRKQAPVVASNVVAALDGRTPDAVYDGYGSCPLTVERGKVVLAEFGYGGKLLPTFPRWLINGKKPSRLAWLLKERLLPPVYYKLMLRGREWFAEPGIQPQSAARANNPQKVTDH